MAFVNEINPANVRPSVEDPAMVAVVIEVPAYSVSSVQVLVQLVACDLPTACAASVAEECHHAAPRWMALAAISSLRW